MSVGSYNVSESEGSYNVSAFSDSYNVSASSDSYNVSETSIAYPPLTSDLDTWSQTINGTAFKDGIGSLNATILPSMVLFNGADINVDIAKYTDVSGDDFSLEVEFKKTSAVSVDGYIFDCRDGVDDGIRIYWDGTAEKLYASINGVDLIFTGAFSAGDVHILKIWRYGNTLYGLCDAEAQNVDVTGETVSVTSNQIKIGSAYDDSLWLTGGVSYVKYYEFLDTYLKTSWRYPTLFGWAPSHSLGISWRETAWASSFDITAYKIGSANDYYLDPAGDDSDDGSTLLLAKATIAGVIAQILSDAVADANIIVSAGTYSNAWGTSTPAVDCDIICTGEAIFQESTATSAGRVSGVDNIYLEGITFSGGTTGGAFVLAHTTTTCKSYFKDCKFNDSGANGFAAEYGGEIYLDGCIADSNTRDGLNYHDDASGNAPRVFELNCQGTNNGSGDSDNGSTIHDGGSIVRIGGTYTNNIRNIHDVTTGTTSILMSSTVNTSRGAGVEPFNVGLGLSGGPGARMWMFDNTITEGTAVNIQNYAGCYIYNNVDDDYVTNLGEYFYMAVPTFQVVSSVQDAKMVDVSRYDYDGTLNGTGNKISYDADATLYWDYAIIDFDPLASADVKLDVFDKSNGTIHEATTAMDYYDSGEVYKWGVSELNYYYKLQTYFKTAYKGRVFANINSNKVVTEILNYATQKTGSDLTSVLTFCGYIPNPFGSELNILPTAVSDHNGNEANSITGWNETNLNGTGANVFESQSAVKNTGSYAFHIDGNDTPTGVERIFIYITSTIGSGYRITFNWRHVGSGGQWAFQCSNTTLSTITSGETTWLSKDLFYEATANPIVVVFRELSGTNNGGIYVDNLSIQKVTN